VAVEAAHVDFWHKYVGFGGAVVGMSTFGESAPGAALLKYFGITTEAVVKAAKGLN
jgi:transketolase